MVAWELHRLTPNTDHSRLFLARHFPELVTQFATSRPEGCSLLANGVSGQFERSKIITQVPISDAALRAADHPARLAERL